MSTPSTGQQPGAVWSTYTGIGAPEYHRPPAQRTDSPRLPSDAPEPDLTALSLPELRTLRREAQRDEADLSYLRRLLQGRIDILRAELARRTPVDDGPPSPYPRRRPSSSGWRRSSPTPRPGTAPPPAT